MKFNTSKLLVSYLVGFIIMLGVSGCATTASDPRDPLEGWNRGVQTFNDKVDDYALKPVAQGYQWITPSFVDTGVSNFFSNIRDIGVTINDLLQFKLKQGGKDATRFLINSTVGLAGLFDVASHWDFTKHNEDFGQTLGFWGLPPGPYLVLPFIGPSSPRGAVGLVGDTLMNPITYLNEPAIQFGLFGLDLIDTRADLLTASKIAEEAALDRYEFIRDSYIQRREFLVTDGTIPPDEEDFELEEDLDL